MSSVLFLVATEPISRCLAAALHRETGATSRSCADDVGLAVVAARKVAALREPFSHAAKAGGLHLKPEKCKFVARFSTPAELEAISRELAEAWGPAGLFEVCTHPVHLGFQMCPGSAPAQLRAVEEKFKRVVAAIASKAPPAAALAGSLSSRAVSLWSYVASLVDLPLHVELLERDAWAKVLRLPGSSIPIGGFQELAADWGLAPVPKHRRGRARARLRMASLLGLGALGGSTLTLWGR